MRALMFSLVLTVFAAGLLVPAAPVLAQAKSKDGTPEAQQKVETTRDGFPIHFTYWPSTMGKEAPVVVLLHGKSQNRVVWNATTLLRELFKQQFAVIAVDLRKHGESIPADAGSKMKTTTLTKFDYEAMIALDLEAVKKFIYDEHQAQRLNMRKMGLVASEFSTVVALNWAAADWAKKPFDDAPTLAASTPRGQDVQAIVLLSPMETLTGVGTTKTMPFLRQTTMSSLMIFGAKRASDKRSADKLYQLIGGEQQDKENLRHYKGEFPIANGGIDLLVRVEQATPLAVNFLKKHVADVQAEWRDRRSRLE